MTLLSSSSILDNFGFSSAVLNYHLGSWCGGGLLGGGGSCSPPSSGFGLVVQFNDLITLEGKGSLLERRKGTHWGHYFTFFSTFYTKSADIARISEYRSQRWAENISAHFPNFNEFYF